ncbi:MAG: spore coat associated protein CotJA [Clostridiales bacterium]|nr:spore coat associated protein CotJA [Clostridiales bacterium]
MQEEDPCPSLPLAQASVRDQPYGRMFNPREALLHGTLFPCLVSR